VSDKRFDKSVQGWKNKPCPFDPEKLHRWTTFERVTKDGLHVKVTACAKCMRMP